MNSKDSTTPTTQPAVPPITARIAHVMANLGITGLPRNYELLFEALNGNAGVAREIAALGKAPDQAALDSIALRHALPSHNVLAAGQAAGEAVRVLAEISAAAETSRRDRAVALQELEEIAARMRKDPVLGISDFSSDTVRLLSILRDILGADRSSAARLEDLQAHLDSLRSGLSVSREALTHDPVTGLGNHAALLGRLKAFFQAEAASETAALLMFRVEQLKEFAETHPAGAAEKTLKRLAAIFRRSVKKGDFVARTGPDVFCLLLSDVSREIAVTIARRIAVRVAEKPFPFMDRELPAGFLTLTAGVSMSDAAKAPAAFYDQAEQALTYAGDAGIALRIYSAEVAERAGRGYRGGAAA
ncbi:GGDEF domain-containing protein [Shinella granuli]|jgi:diguanylate cyclase|uniref:diguanylate cyclase n=1 Tax=Shinella granuli TaxID=323621 RepID=A0A4R2D0H5_SHIGR|nr:GGDEF domain-containing protein [Shinella granuli]TCN47798.1 diguanylate cyclase [Shinella granuli]